MICILIANGFEEAEALVPCDLLRRAGFDVRLCAVSDMTAKGAHNISVKCDMAAADVFLSQLEAVILPGGMPGAANIDESAVTDKLLSYAAENGIVIGAICAAPFVLGKRGLLNGKKATCFPSFERFLTGAEVVSENVVKDGNIITSKAAGAAFDFGLALIAALKNKAAADEIKQGIFYEKY